MKRLSYLLIFPVLLIWACGSGGSSSDDDVFYDVASRVLPNINTTLVSGVSVQVNAASTNVCNDDPTGAVQTVCDTFEAYTSDNWNNEEATLGHRVSMTNFYKFIIQTDAYISDGLKKTCEALTGKVKLAYDDASDFWQSEDNYACKASYAESASRFKAYAWDLTNNKYAVMYDHQDDNDEALTYGTKSADAFDLTVKMYGSQGSHRRFTANSTEKTFTMQDVSSSGSRLVLAGYAQGVGKHFLARNEGTPDEYYCFTIDTQQEYTTSSGSTVTVITGLSSSAALNTCDNTDCGGCQSDTITVDGVVKTLPDAVEYLDQEALLMTVPTQHFAHEFTAL